MPYLNWHRHRNIGKHPSIQSNVVSNIFSFDHISIGNHNNRVVEMPMDYNEYYVMHFQ